MNNITVAIFAGGHDFNITILKNGKVLAILQEERFSKIKYDYLFPLLSLEKISQYTKIIDNLVIISSPPYREIIINYFKKIKTKINNIITPSPSYHHLFHASSGFYGSGFKEATCICIDAYGGYEYLPKSQTRQLGYYTSTIFSKHLNSPNFTLKYANLYYNPIIEDPYYEFKFSDNIELNRNLDIGMIYSSICLYAGFSNREAGKIMGLSSYGSFNNQLPPILYKDTILGNMNLFKGDRIVDIKSNPILKDNTNFKLLADISYSTQKSLEKTFIYRINQALSINPSCNNIVFSGGCALNVVGNYIVKKHFPDINFYFDPIGTDIGQSYGAAKYYYYLTTKSTKLMPLKNLYLGYKYSKKSLLNSIKKYA